MLQKLNHFAKTKNNFILHEFAQFNSANNSLKVFGQIVNGAHVPG